MKNTHYGRLLLMAALSFVSMYVLMTAAMVISELALMGAMYHNKRLNALIIAASIVVLIAFWFLLRQQTAISDKQFLRSMIPHHAGAILMCEKAPIGESWIRDLCSKAIIPSQQSEIDQMKAKLRELEQ